MSSSEILRSLLGHFGMLSLLAVGGGGTVIPDMHRYLVEANGWMTDAQFAALYAISQASPGPNILFVALFGWQVAGAGGTFAAMVGMCGPSSLIALGFEYFAGRSPHARWPGLIKRGLSALTIGLLMSTAGARQQRGPWLDCRGGDAADHRPDAEDAGPSADAGGAGRRRGAARTGLTPV